MTAVIENGTTTTVGGADLLLVLESAIKSASADNTRPHLNGVLLVRKDGAIVAVSTDGHRLGRFGTVAKGRKACDVLVRLADAKNVAAAIKQAIRSVGKASRGVVSVAMTAPRELPEEPATIIFTITVAGNPFAALECRSVAAAFPPYERVIPAHAGSTEYLGDGAAIQSVSASYLCDAVTACAPFGELEIVRGASWRDPLVVRAGKGDFATVVLMPMVIADAIAQEKAAQAEAEATRDNVIPLRRHQG